MGTPNRNARRERALEAKGHPTRVDVQCTRCDFVSHVKPPQQLPTNWELTLLGETLCPRCVQRDLERAS